jgi:type IV secretory pathway TrbF-like protein
MATNVTPTAWAPVPSDHIPDTKRRYLERYGATLVTNAYLRIAVFCLSAVCVGLLVVHWQLAQSVRTLKPLIIRINDIGRAEPVTYDALTYRPQAAEIRYFLNLFVRQHFGRQRATIRHDFPASLLFLDASLATPILHEYERRNTIEQFLASQDPEVDVLVNNVAIEDLRAAPYRASVDFELVYSQRGSQAETKRERHTGSFVFAFRQVSNDVIPTNPLGLTISYFRTDQAFE